MPLPIRSLVVAVLATALLGAQAPARSWPWSRLAEEVARIAAEVEGRVGVFIQDPASGETVALADDEAYPAASTIKVALLHELYRQAQASPAPLRLSEPAQVAPADRAPDSAVMGHLSAEARPTLRDLALFTVVVSDNTATNALISRVGLDRVNSGARALGLRHTRLQRKMMDLQAAREGRENLSSPRDLGLLFRALLDGPSLPPAARADLLALLKVPKEGFLGRRLPEEVPFASKPGVLPGVRADAGILWVQGRPLVVAVMTSHLRDERQGEEAIARIAHRAAACLDLVLAAGPEGRLLGPLHIR